MPKTFSTPSAFRHSMIASTARMWRSSVTALARFASGLREVQVAAAAHADLVVEHDYVAALGAAPARLAALPAPQDRRDRADDRHHQPDHEPDQERAALDLADHPGRQAEADRQSDVLHRIGLEDAQCPDD